MISAVEIGKSIAVYRKHGWVLRRLLLSAELKRRVIGDLSHLIDGVQVTDSDFDAAWFSRPPKPGGVAWEIRYLSEAPYALVEKMDENSIDFEETLRAVESRLRETVLIRKSA